MKDRRIKILFSIINSYILEGEPIGSKSLADDYAFDVSPATIRNDMSSLEKKGLLKKAHTSSGRLPSDKGYRFFVDYILENGLTDHISSRDYEFLKKALDKRYYNATDIVNSATKILASFTNLTAVSMTVKNKINSLANIELLRVNDYTLLLVLVYDNGVVVNDLINLRYTLETSDLDFINNVLRKNLIGAKVNEISSIVNSIENKLKLNYTNLLDIVKAKIKNESDKDLLKEVKIEGLSNIFNFKEIDDIVKARDFINLFENSDFITDFLTGINDKSLVISIGEENEIEKLKNNTIITSYFRMDDNTIGKIGVVGLTRIRYRQVIEYIRLISDLLNE